MPRAYSCRTFKYGKGIGVSHRNGWLTWSCGVQLAFCTACEVLIRDLIRNSGNTSPEAAHRAATTEQSLDQLLKFVTQTVVHLRRSISIPSLGSRYDANQLAGQVGVSKKFVVYCQELINLKQYEL